MEIYTTPGCGIHTQHAVIDFMCLSTNVNNQTIQWNNVKNLSSQ